MTRVLHSPWMATIVGAVAFLASMLVFWLPHAKPPPIIPNEIEVSAKGPSWDFHNPEMDLLMAELKNEKEALAAKKQQLDDFAATLKNEQFELQQLTQRVYLAQMEFDQNVSRVKSEESANIKKLGKLYAGMSPEAAATVFKELDDATVVKLMTTMKETEIAAILENMTQKGGAQAKRVAAISEKLRLSFAEVKSGPPKGSQ